MEISKLPSKEEKEKLKITLTQLIGGKLKYHLQMDMAHLKRWQNFMEFLVWGVSVTDIH